MKESRKKAPFQKKEGRTAKPWRAAVIAAMVLAALAIAAMGASLRNGYVSWDDDKTLAQFPPPAIFGLAGVVKQILLGTALPDKAYYPVFQMFWILDLTLFQKNPALSHFLNLLFHIANTLLLWWCLRALLRRIGGIENSQALLAATLAAALFATHPVNVEPVNWVSGRKVLLAFFFSMLSFRCVLSGSWRGIMLGSACFGLAVLSNATALGVAPLIIAWLLFFERERWVPSFLRAAPFFLIAAAAAFFRAGQQKAEIGAVLTKSLTWNQNLGLIFSAQAHQFADLFVPTCLIAVYPRTLDGLAMPSAWAGIALLAALAGGAVVLWRSGKVAWRVAAFGLGWFLLVLSPMVWHHHERADRHLYLSAPGIFLVIGILFSTLAARWQAGSLRQRVLFVVAGAWVAGLVVMSNAQMRYWLNSETLFRRAIACSDKNLTAYVNLGNALEGQKDIEGALAAYSKALEIKADNYNVHASLGSLFLGIEEREKAEKFLRTALELHEPCPEAHNNLGIILAGEGKDDEALRHFARSVEISPFYVEALHNLGRSLLAHDRPQEALEQFQQAIKVDPRCAPAFQGSGLAWAKLGDLDKAIRAHRRAVELDPDSPELLLDLAGALYEEGQYEETEQLLFRVEKMQPNSPEIQQMLALNYIKMERLDLAEHHYRNATILNPEDPVPRINLGQVMLSQDKRDEAVEQYLKALALAEQRRDPELTRHIRERLRDAAPPQPQREPSVEREEIGPMSEETKADLFTLSNSNGLEVKVLSFGATITSVKVPDRNGNFEPVTLSLEPVSNYLSVPCVLGTVIGRFGNRIAGGGFTLDDVRYDLPSVNSQGVHLHGGKEGFHRVLWDAESFKDAESAGVKLSHTSPDGHEGYPGTLQVEVVYKLNNKNELWMEYTATTDTPTVINMTNHAYWNLAGAGSGDVLGHVMAVRAERYLPLDEDKIPTGELREVAGTPLDFRNPKAMGAEIENLLPGSYDNCFVLDPSNELVSPAARVVEPRSGRVMEVYTSQPGLQFFIPVELSEKLIEAGAPAGKYPAFCLETQHFPDGPNKPEFPSTVLRPGQIYTQITVHKFGIQE